MGRPSDISAFNVDPVRRGAGYPLWINAAGFQELRAVNTGAGCKIARQEFKLPHCAGLLFFPIDFELTGDKVGQYGVINFAHT